MTDFQMLSFQEALAVRPRIGQVTRYQPEVSVSSPDESLTSETKVPVTTSPLPLIPPQAEQVPTETQVMAAHFSLSCLTEDIVPSRTRAVHTIRGDF